MTFHHLGFLHYKRFLNFLFCDDSHSNESKNFVVCGFIQVLGDAAPVLLLAEEI